MIFGALCFAPPKPLAALPLSPPASAPARGPAVFARRWPLGRRRGQLAVAATWGDRAPGSGARGRWWSDEGDGYDEDDEGSDFDDEEEDFFEDPWEKIWIFKVFKAYGYLLPFIIASMLLATGPKAFLMALAIPVGQSAISLAFEKIWGRQRQRSSPKSNSWRQSSSWSQDGFRRRKGEDFDMENERRTNYETWVSNNTADGGDESKTSTFGGWDELEKERGSYRERMSSPTMDSMAGQSPRLSKRGKYREIPLFLRLLVAVFPFLGSWFRIL